MDDTLSAADAGLVGRRGRRLLAKGLITHRQYALLDAMLWSCRVPGRATIRTTYDHLQRITHMARGTLAAAIRVLTNLGLIQRTRHRVLVIGQNGGRVWKQLANIYRLMTGEGAILREFNTRTDSEPQEITILASMTPRAAVKEAQEALARVARDRAARRAADWLRKRGHTG